MWKQIALCVVATGIVLWWVSPTFIDVRAELLEDHPANWDEEDVGRWLNTTVRYPEYASVFRMHAVDGPTLFYLTEADLQFLQISNPVHRAKLLAHLDVLRGKCVCTPPAQTDFWEHARKRPYQVLYLGALFEYSPRIGFAYMSLFESELLAGVLTYFGGEYYPTAIFVVALLLFVASPHLGLILFALRVVLPTNWVIVLAYCLSHFGKLLQDWQELSSLSSGLMERRESLQLWYNYFFNVSSTRKKWLFEMFNPLAAIILGPFVPWYLECALIYVYMIIYILPGIAFVGEKALQYFGATADANTPSS